MNKNEYIEHLTQVVKAVFSAELNISSQWKPLLHAAINEKWTSDKQKELMDNYTHAIADEMIRVWLANGHTMEELTKDFDV